MRAAGVKHVHELQRSRESEYGRATGRGNSRGGGSTKCSGPADATRHARASPGARAGARVTGPPLGRALQVLPPPYSRASGRGNGRRGGGARARTVTWLCAPCSVGTATKLRAGHRAPRSARRAPEGLGLPRWGHLFPGLGAGGGERSELGSRLGRGGARGAGRGGRGGPGDREGNARDAGDGTG